MRRRIPIKAAKDVANAYEQDQVIIFTFDRKTGLQHCVTYGRTFDDCAQAAEGGNRIKKLLGWPEELCNTKPKRAERK